MRCIINGYCSYGNRGTWNWTMSDKIDPAVGVS